jgi:hypothetical protein
VSIDFRSLSGYYTDPDTRIHERQPPQYDIEKPLKTLITMFGDPNVTNSIKNDKQIIPEQQLLFDDDTKPKTQSEILIKTILAVWEINDIKLTYSGVTNYNIQNIKKISLLSPFRTKFSLTILDQKVENEVKQIINILDESTKSRETAKMKQDFIKKF